MSLARKTAGLAVVVLLSAYATDAQVITTIAGTNWTFPPTPLAAVNAPLSQTAGVALDGAGNVYVADSDNFRVMRVSPSGILDIVAGNGTFGYTGDEGAATSAALGLVVAVAADGAGNLYICDESNNVVRKVSPAGIITTFAGNGTAGYSGDGGPATSAQLKMPYGVAVDASSNVYIAEADFFPTGGNNRVRKVAVSGIITTFAGSGQPGYTGDGGPATSATFASPTGLAVDSAGNLYIADTGNGVIREVTPGGIISSVPGTHIQNSEPQGVTVDGTGDLFVADPAYNWLIELKAGASVGMFQVIAGGHNIGFSGDGGPSTNSQLNYPVGVAVDSLGDIYIADQNNFRIRKVSSQGTINTFAGNGNFQFSGDGESAVNATLNQPAGINLDNSENLFIADTYNNRIRKVSTSGVITTVAGNGIAVDGGNGSPAVSASIELPEDVAVDNSGNIFIADHDGYRVVSSAGIIGSLPVLLGGPSGGPGQGLATDAGGNLYVIEDSCNCIQELKPDGTLTTIAGNGTAGFSGDGGPATAAEINVAASYLPGIVIDGQGDVFFSDSGNNRIREIMSDGTIMTVAGNGTAGYSGDGGYALAADLSPQALAIDSIGDLYITDPSDSVLRKVDIFGMITTVAGNGQRGFSGDGSLATNAELSAPTGVAVDPFFNIYIADTGNDRIREVLFQPPSVSATPQQLQFTASSNGAPSQPQSLNLTSPVAGLAFSVNVPNDATWLQVSPSSGASPRLIQVVANPAGLAPNTYQTTLSINVPNGNPSSISVAITFTVTAALSPVLSVDKESLSFPFPVQGSARSQTLIVSNAGGGTLTFSVAAATNSGGNWLSVSPASGQALAGSPITVAVTANPTGLASGAYSGQVTVTAGTQSQSVPVIMTISTLSQAILLSQSGLSFLTVQNGGVVPVQSFAVMNIGTGVVNWTTSTTTLTGGNWLQVTPASGSSDATAETSPRVTVGVDASQLTAGAYYGLVRVNAAGAANSPQVLTVFLQVLPPGTNVPPAVQPAQLLFTAPAGGESPGSQTIQVYNIVAQAKSFQSQVSAETGLSIITLPQDATLDPQQPTEIVVQPITTGLGAGVYNGTVTLQFSDGTVSAVQVSVIVSNNAGINASARGNARPSDSSSCTPSKLVPQLTSLGASFQVSAGWPAALIVNVKDDCGNPMQASGSVTVSFSNGDPELSLQSQGNGGWETTWQTGNATGGVTLTVNAAYQALAGNAVVNGSLASQQQPPVFPSSGIVSVATAVSNTPLAPGSVISIFGNRLAENIAIAQSLPLPAEIAGTDTQVFISGMTASGTSTGLPPLPLYYVSQGQINAMIPYEASVDTSLQLVVQRGTTLSVAVPISTAQAQPAIFSSSGLPGGTGVIQVYPAGGGAEYFASTSTPAHAGDTIVAYCTGLGAVNPMVTDGAAPEQLSSTTSPAQMMIGGQSAAVSFSGLTPGFAGLYQVNAVVPAGVQTGANVPVTLSIAGQTSPIVTIAIQ